MYVYIVLILGNVGVLELFIEREKKTSECTVMLLYVKRTKNLVSIY